MSFTKNVTQIFQKIKPTLKGTDRRTCERMLIVHAEQGKMLRLYIAEMYKLKSL